jgi:hypothetical protein
MTVSHLKTSDFPLGLPQDRVEPIFPRPRHRGYNRGMEDVIVMDTAPGVSELVALGAIGVVFSAFCVWLTVRLINRRERWAVDTAMAIAAIAFMLISFAVALILGPLMFGKS